MKDAEVKKRPSWVPWMHVAGVAYAVAILLMFSFVGIMDAPALVATIGYGALVVGTVAFIGGWGRYLATKR